MSIVSILKQQLSIYYVCNFIKKFLENKHLKTGYKIIFQKI